MFKEQDAGGLGEMDEWEKLLTQNLFNEYGSRRRYLIELEF